MKYFYLKSLTLSFLLIAFTTMVKAQCSETNAAACSCPTPGATDCLLLPDILAGKNTLKSTSGWTEYDNVTTTTNKGLVRLDVATPNVGWGPIQTVSTDDYICGSDTLHNFFPSSGFLCPDGSYPKRLIKQKMYYKSGSTFQYQMRDAGWMTYHPSHGHIHIDNWGLYTIRLRDVSIADTLQWPIVNSGLKTSFCLIDLSTCSSRLGDCLDGGGHVLNNTNFPNFGLAGGYSCNNVRQGISVGNVDVYSQSLDESFVKVPYEACNGDYYIVVQVDPENHFLEINENNNWLAAKIPLTKQHATNTNPYAYIFSTKGNVICDGQTLDLKASGASNYLWNTGATTQNITVNAAGKYWVNATTPCGNKTSDTLEVFTAGASSVPSEIKTDTVCAGDHANLYASGNAQWFDAPTNGNLIYVGNNFQTGSLSNNTSFYVVDQPSTMSGVLGPVTTNFSGTNNTTQTRSDYLIFNAFLPFKLKKVTVNATTAGTRIIELRTMYGKTMLTKSVTLTAGIQDVVLDMFVPSGLNMQLGFSASSASPALTTSTTTAANIGYPFKVKSLANIVGSSLGDKFYPFFYNWQIEGTPQSCNTVTRTEVKVVVAPDVNPTISGLAPFYYNTSNPAILTGSPAGGTFNGSGMAGNTFYPNIAGIGAHEITYTYKYGNCIRMATGETQVKIDSSVLVGGVSIQLNGNSGTIHHIHIVGHHQSEVSVRILGSAGQVMAKSKFVATAGSYIYDFNDLVYRLPRGLYLIEVYHADSGTKKTMKFLN